MKYISTRGTDTKEVFSAYAIKTGLASDKGLYMPNTIQKHKNLYRKLVEVF